MFELLNELALAFLERFVLPHASGATFPALGYTIFPDTMEADLSEVANLDKHLLHSFIQGATFRERRLDKVIDYRPAGVRIRQFLALRGPNESPEDLDEGCTEGLFNVLFFILTEVIELAHTRAIDAQGELRLRPDEACYFLPRYFRGAILTDSALFSRLRYSRFFWTGQWTRAWSESSDLE